MENQSSFTVLAQQSLISQQLQLLSFKIKLAQLVALLSTSI
jgi:hypothetical protein